jgi:hypothetical protein
MKTRAQLSHTSLVVECHDLSANNLWLCWEQRVHGFGSKKTKGCLEAVQKKFGLQCVRFSVNKQNGSRGLYIMVRSISMTKERFPWLVTPDRVRQRWPRRSIFRVQMTDAEGIRPFLVLHDNDKSSITTI